MPSRSLHLILLVVSALLACSWGHAIERTSSELDARSLQRRAPPTKRSLCSPANDPPVGQKIEARAPPFPQLLGKMALPENPPYNGDVDKFMNDRTKRVFNLVSSVTGGDTMSSAKHDQLPVRTVLHRAVRTMCGCSALIIFSEKAIYFTHYWENLAFSANPGDPPANLQREALDPLVNGRGTVHESLAANAANYRDQPGLKAFLMTPKAEDGPGLQYPVEVGQIGDKVFEIIGIRPETVMYEPIDSQDARLGTNGKGTALFQYVGNEFKVGPPALAKIWIETTEYMSLRWAGPDGSPNPINPPSPIDPPGPGPILPPGGPVLPPRPILPPGGPVLPPGPINLPSPIDPPGPLNPPSNRPPLAPGFGMIRGPGETNPTPLPQPGVDDVSFA